MRLYTGLENSLETGVWEPEGVPTVYNFINRATEHYRLSLILTCKDSGSTYTSGWRESTDREPTVAGLNANVIVLAGTRYFNRFIPRKIGMIFRDIRHLCKIISFTYREKPDVIYCDGANVTFAYCLTKLFPQKPIILRLLGICSFLRSLPFATRLVHRLYKLAFTGKFASVIGTQDGTGTEFFLEAILCDSVPRQVLLNGTDQVSAQSNVRRMLPQDWFNPKNKQTTVLFVGRVEEDKGIRTFLTAVIGALSDKTTKLRAIIVGSGSLLDEMKIIVRENSLTEKICFTGSVPHKTIHEFHKLADIYVSTNIDGNLTNANLEAIAANACMIIPNPQTERYIDVKTSKYLSDCVTYFEVGDSSDLAEKIIALARSPEDRKQLSMNLAKRKTTFMRSWDERINEELEIIDALIS